MQLCWRITKYDPKKRDGQGRFSAEEWTAYSDIGKTYAGKVFSFDEYIEIEALYIDAIKYFMTFLGISSLQVKALEKSKKITTDVHANKQMTDFFKSIKEDDWVMQSQIEDVCKLILREQLWCKLENDQKMYVHFGYDYYMYIGSELVSEGLLEKIRSTGLFVETFQSPYEDQD